MTAATTAATTAAKKTSAWATLLRRSVLVFGIGAWLVACAQQQVAVPATPAVADEPPAEPREFRAAWVATVANIDWPSAPGLTPDVQRSEALAILNRSATMGLNAIVLQVRPSGDAIYPSALEPWTEYLTGAQGRAPQPAWDPLAFWVAEAHRRSIELHVWLNPYRAKAAPAKTPLVAPHLGVRRPELVKTYGNLMWIDPGEPEAAAHTLAVVADVVRRYDIDGVHIDDYFYPYPINAADGTEQHFPDDESFARYKLAGGALARDDWRRSNVDSLVQQMNSTVHSIKPWVRFGVSPFGVGKPDRRPAGVIGFSQYDKLYADVERWFENGWMDYLVPQLYWQIDRPGLQFPVLLDYWLGENKARRHVWPGLYTSLITKGEPGTVLGTRAWLAREVLDQVQLQRAKSTGSTASPADAASAPAGAPAGLEPSVATGHVHFSMTALMQDRDGIATLLQFGPYAQTALVPATPWLDNSPPPAPRLRLSSKRVVIEPGAGEASHRWAVWRRVLGQWKLSTLPGAERSLDPAGADRVVVSAIDRVGNLSARTTLQLAASQ
jgi:uncharacterized lipoprotein YddW (UPF0748 family)